MSSRPDYYGQEFAAVNEHASGGVQVIAAPASGRIIVDYYMVSMGTAGTCKFSSSTGGTVDTDHFTLHCGTVPVTQSDVRLELNYGDSLELTANQTFSALIGYHIEK